MAQHRSGRTMPKGTGAPDLSDGRLFCSPEGPISNEEIVSTSASRRFLFCAQMSSKEQDLQECDAKCFPETQEGIYILSLCCRVSRPRMSSPVQP
ncbi:hypothetical protein AV530_000819 [Patagioenas fasciata monilis]|uniref:Uncharacterized protein n=1 Tax=Patagioenas fasciata monilis TaxID=372326 RepID=A0A1V4KSB7_PATFA|nr:hypothetical protein AV530_000819 [Patagioenas fasciata monilis]